MEIIVTSQGARTAYGWESGDQPGEPVFSAAVPPAIQASLAAALAGNLPGFDEPYEIRALGECRHVVGRYRIVCGAGEFFLRVSSLAGHPALERALVGHLQADGVSVNELVLAGAEAEYEGWRFRLDARPFLNCRHDNDSFDDLIAIAQLLRRCHASLRNFPQAAEVGRIARERFLLLDETARRLKTLLDAGRLDEITPYADWTQRHEDFLRRLAESFHPDYAERAGAQCLHGQVHRANVVFIGEKPVLIDFEEAVHVYAPVEWDVAHLVQRFALRGHPEPESAARRLAAIETHYGPVGGEAFAMMRQIAWFSMVILVRGWLDQRICAPRAEYDKFVALEAQAARYGALFAR